MQSWLGLGWLDENGSSGPEEKLGMDPHTALLSPHEHVWPPGDCKTHMAFRPLIATAIALLSQKPGDPFLPRAWLWEHIVR